MITTTGSNYETNYNTIQLSLPLDLGVKIDPELLFTDKEGK